MFFNSVQLPFLFTFQEEIDHSGTDLKITGYHTGRSGASQRRTLLTTVTEYFGTLNCFNTVFIELTRFSKLFIEIQLIVEFII